MKTSRILVDVFRKLGTTYGLVDEHLDAVKRNAKRLMAEWNRLGNGDIRIPDEWIPAHGYDSAGLSVQTFKASDIQRCLDEVDSALSNLYLIIDSAEFMLDDALEHGQLEEVEEQ